MQIDKEKSVFIFDLDDTLYPEVEFLRSGYKAVAESIFKLTGKDIYYDMLKKHNQGIKVFEWILSSHILNGEDMNIESLLKIYRNHFPTINLRDGAQELLEKLISLKIPIGLITDGRSISQRNKLKALGITKYFTDIIISEEFGSEKPDERNFFYFKNKYPEKNIFYVGDNPSKDFFVPSSLGWCTICLLDDGAHIHKQDIMYGLKFNLIVKSFKELNNYFLL